MKHIFTIFSKNGKTRCYSFNILHFVNLNHIPFELVKIDRKTKEKECFSFGGVINTSLICVDNSKEDWIIFYSRIEKVGGVKKQTIIPFATKKGFDKFRDALRCSKSI